VISNKQRYVRYWCSDCEPFALGKPVGVKVQAIMNFPEFPRCGQTYENGIIDQFSGDCISNAEIAWEYD
jgi:hypothetical protein